jgi:hypothetical protein
VDLIFKIGVLAVFIATYAGSSALSYRLQQKFVRDSTAGTGTWLIAQATTLISVVSFFTYIFLLTGFLSIPLIVLFLLAAEIGLILGRAGSAVVGADQTHTTRMIAWVAFGYGVRNPWLFVVVIVLAAIFVFIYPIVASYVFLVSPPADLSLTIIRLTVVQFVAVGYLFVVPNYVGLLTSPYLDERSRARVLVTSSSSLILTGLFLGLGFWAFSPQAAASTTSIPVSVSVELVLFLLAFFALSLLLPYAIGTISARRRRADLLGRERRCINLASRTLRVIGSAWRTELDVVSTTIQKDVDEVMAADRAIAAMEKLDDSQENQNVALTRAGFLAAQVSDPRFQFRSRLMDLSATISRVTTDLEKRRTSAAREQFAQKWSSVLHEQGEELEEEAKRVSEGIPKASLAVVGATAVMSVLLQEVTKSGWQTMVDAINP